MLIVQLFYQNYFTTEVTIPLVIYIIVSMILFLSKSQLLRKILNIINTDCIIYISIIL